MKIDSILIDKLKKISKGQKNEYFYTCISDWHQ